MGRGSRPLEPLQLRSIPPAYDQRWLDALIKFEKFSYHRNSNQTGCSIPPPPSGAPRFVVVTGRNYASAPEPHTFTYCANLDDLKLVLRNLKTRWRYTWEYHPDSFTFTETFELPQAD